MDTTVEAGLPEGDREFLAAISVRTRMLIPDDVYYASCRKTVAVAGMGGIGGLVVELLARWGIKAFRLVDKDRFETSNLNRQVLATVNDIGRWKAEVAAERIKAINPHADVQLVLNEKLRPANIDQFVDDADIVINEADSHSCYVLLDGAARRRRIPMVMGHGAGASGMKIYVFDYRRAGQRGLEAPFRFAVLNRLRNKYAKTTIADAEGMSDDELEMLDRHPTFGSVGFTVNMCACYVVAEVIKLLTGIGRVPLYPKEIVIDLFAPSLTVRSKYSPAYVLRQLRDRQSRR